MLASDDPRHILARRLRELREEHWPGWKLTQGQLAEALGGKEPISVPLISSWESHSNPKAPPEHRLRAYATFFATERSVEHRPFQLLAVSQLTVEERARRDVLLQELTLLRRAALGQVPPAGSYDGTIWQFPPGQDVTIVGSELPERLRQNVPYTDPDSPDYIEMYRYPDLDALFELHGHLRAVNPNSQVNLRTASELAADDYTAHLVLLGGVDWNAVTANLLDLVELPVRQENREPASEPGGFEVTTRNERKVFRPILRKSKGQDALVEDVAHFYRSPSPFNLKRTVTICNGCFQRGTLGAVRALTDARFRERNELYVRERFPGWETFSIVFRVTVAGGHVVTPDWTRPDIRLHEWPMEVD